MSKVHSSTLLPPCRKLETTPWKANSALSQPPFNAKANSALSQPPFNAKPYWLS